MKWLFIILVTAIFVVSAKSKCEVADFYALSWLNDPSLRHSQLSMWLTTNGDSCTSEQLVILWNRLSEWAGASDSAELRAKILHYYAKAREREKK